jgi:hypothetical protein
MKLLRGILYIENTMRKLTALAAALAALFSACSKHNGGSSYYFSFECGGTTYTTTIDSLVLVQMDTAYHELVFSGNRTPTMTDSAAAGALSLDTWQFLLLSGTNPASNFSGSYQPDTTSNSNKIVWPGDTRFSFYTKGDPNLGHYVVVYNVPFTVTVSQWTSGWYSGTFEGQVVGTNANTQLADTLTITNGKFKLPAPATQ